MTDDLISRLMEDLNSEWPEEVQSATHAIASLGQPVVLPLLDAIEGHNPTLRRHAALVLEQLQPQEALPPLIDLLSEEEVPLESKIILVRVLVALMEEGREDDQLFSLLVALSHDNETEIRFSSVKGLGKIGSANGNVELCRLAQDPVESIRAEAQSHLTHRSRQKKAKGVQPLEPAMLEAAARLRVRHGLSDNRQEAISEVLNGVEGAARDLLPLLEDAGIKTLQEVTPLLKQIKDAKAHLPLIDIIIDRSNPWQRRRMALRSLNKLQPEDSFLDEMYRSLLTDPIPSIRIEAMNAITHAKSESYMDLLAGMLKDEESSVRSQAALLLAERLGPEGKNWLRPLLEALTLYPEDESKMYLLQGLAQVLIGAPGDQLFVPEVLDLLDPSDATAFEVVLGILDKIVPRQPSAQTSRTLLALLDTMSEPHLVEQTLAILVRILPTNTAEATHPLIQLLQRFDTMPIQAFVLRLLGRIADEVSVRTLIAHATGQGHEHLPALKQLAEQILEELEGTLFEVWKEDDTYHYRQGLVCRCGGQLQWRSIPPREELRCTLCDEEYILLEPFALIPVKEVDVPLCFCPGCVHKQPLTCSTSSLPYCPKSQETYVIRNDNQAVQRVSQLEFGLCECCEPPQPLDLRGEDVVCIETGRRLRDTQEHAALELPDTEETPTFSVSNTSTGRATPSQRRSTGRTSHPSINAPSTLTRIRSFQLRQALLSEPAEEQETEGKE